LRILIKGPHDYLGTFRVTDFIDTFDFDCIRSGNTVLNLDPGVAGKKSGALVRPRLPFSGIGLAR
jgi:hypothetical protein